jgi:pyrophosphate--fructose-6-phosphate 1-phosphotransferase
MSPLQKIRLNYEPPLPIALTHELEPYLCDSLVNLDPEIEKLFPELAKRKTVSFKEGKGCKDALRVGVVLSGGQAPGGHNVIVGLFRALKRFNEKSSLIGFLDGHAGIIDNKTRLLDKVYVESFLNQGGFDMIGSGRTKVESEEALEKCRETILEHKLDGLVIIGGDDSNTNAAILGEYFLAHKVPCTVVGVPKTIDGDLKNCYVETSFGFDTACKVYSEIIGNILKDTLSAKKYWYFIKLMGRSASHITLECALQTHPNLTYLSEEKRELDEIVEEMAALITARAKEGKDYGVILIPEGIIEYIPEFKEMVGELNRAQPLTPASKKIFDSLSPAIQDQLQMDRDPHNNVQVSKIETERLFIELVQAKLDKSIKFSPQPLFIGYEGRSALPSNFDAQYCYALGFVAAQLIAAKATGTMATCSNLMNPSSEWSFAGIPLISMLTMEERGGEMKPVIEKAFVDLEGPIYAHFKKESRSWKNEDRYLSPGPIQFFGPEELTESRTQTLAF